MRTAMTAMLAMFLALATDNLSQAQETESGDRVQESYLRQGSGFRPNYRSDYNEWQSGYRATPFQTELGTHVGRPEQYDYPVYAGEHPLGFTRTSWGRPTRGYSPPAMRSTTPGYISHMRHTNDPPSWVNREAVRPDDRAIREAASLQLPPAWTPAGQQLEQEMRPQAPPPTIRQRVRSWLPW